MSRRYQAPEGESSERIPLREISNSDNPSFEGHDYDSFAQYQPADLEEEYLAEQDISDDQVFEQDLTDDQVFEQELKSTLPSTGLRQLARQGTLHRLKSGRGDQVDGAPDETNNVEVDDELLDHDIIIDESREMENIRNMTTTLEHKKSVRLRMKDQVDGHRPISGWQNFKFTRAMKWEKFKKSVKDSVTSFNVWQSHMKQVEGSFGTGVLSYFTFLRWLLYINLAVSLLTISFLFVPQMIHDQSSRYLSSSNFSGIELLTGEGYFAATELYYGIYTNEKVSGSYDMKYAYLLVGGGYAIICIMILATSMARSYKQNFIAGGDGGENLAPFSSKVFCSWDYGISNKETAQIKKKSFAQFMLETLGSERAVFSRDMFTLCCTVFTRIVMNIIAIALIGGSAFLIYYVTEISVEETFETDDHLVIYGLLPAITMSGINLIVPTGFRLIVSIENYANPKHGLTINLLRTTTLKLASLVVYTVTVISQLSKVESNVMASRCWENFLGQAFYKLAVIDFISVLLATFFEEFVRGIIARHCECCSKHYPGFDISKNVLNLIYAQGICWLGTFYCPLLPLINVIKLIITFYIKKISVVRNCRPSTRPFKASQMLLWFLSLLSLMLILALVAIGYIIMGNAETLKPSQTCGSFRGLDRIYDLVPEIIEDLPDVLRDVITFISSLTVLASILFLMGLLAYYFKMRKVSNEKKIKLLKDQLSLAGQDKKFLIEKLRRVMKPNSHID